MSPRSSTEQLVAYALARLGTRPARVADVGTGSGAIAVALAVARPSFEVWATDVSAAAVMLARRNVARHDVGDRVQVRQGDLLAPVPGTFDLIAANLPYLPESERERHLDVAGDPFTAVFAEGDGLDTYRRLLREAPSRLRDDGAVVFQLHRRVVVASRADLTHVVGALPGLAAAA